MELNHDHLTRQLDIIPVAKLGQKVTIIGAGAIGSFLGLSLAKMGLTDITVYDFDDVSIENMSNQFFRFSDIGNNKAFALKGLIKDFTGTEIQAFPLEFEEEHASKLTGIVVVAVDSMKARKNIFEWIKAKGFQVDLIIDPRMSAEFYVQYSMKPFDEKDRKTYEKVLFADEEAVQERCTAKSTVYTATLAAGMVVKSIKNWMLSEEYPRVLNWSIKSSSDGSLTAHPGNALTPTQ